MLEKCLFTFKQICIKDEALVWSSFIFLFSFFSMLGIKCRALHMLDKHSTMEIHL
jgi:hypothetical protein